MRTVRPGTRASTAVAIGAAIRDLRRTVGLTQAVLARRAGVSQTWVSAIERGCVARLRFDTAESLAAAMGAHLTLAVDAPYLADRRLQRDAGHARCVAYVVARLRAAGWQVATEVEVGGDRSRGWIDVLAHHPTSGMLLVVEVKTELHDLGAIQRQLGWYEREAWTSARRVGWRPQRSVAALLLLATTGVDSRAAENRRLLELDFPGRAAALRAIAAGGVPERHERHVAMIDPMSRRADWLRPLRIDGRRTDAPYVDYADFMRARHARSRAHRVAARTDGPGAPARMRGLAPSRRPPDDRRSDQAG